MTSKIIDQLVVLLLYCAFILLYIHVIIGNYEFGGFYFESSDSDYIVIPLLILFTYFLPENKNNLIYVYWVLSIYFMLLPAAVLTVCGGKSLMHFLVIFFGTGMVPIFYHTFKRRGSNIDIRARILNLHLLTIFLYGVLLWSAYVANFSFNLNFSKVYDYRFDFNASIGFPLNYILPFAAGPLASFLAVYYFGLKKKTNLLLVLIASLLLYGFTSHKSFMFGPVFSIIIYIFMASGYDLTKLLGILLLTLSSLALFLSDELGVIFGSIFANRLIFIPAGITYEYIREFSELGYIYWAESKVGLGLFISPLAINSVNHIAEIMTGNDKISANVGWLANGFMNLGFVGVFGYSMIIGFIISRVDAWSKCFGVGILAASFGQPLLSLITSIDLFTWLLTGGIMPFMLVLWIFIRKPKINNEIITAENH